MAYGANTNSVTLGTLSGGTQPATVAISWYETGDEGVNEVYHGVQYASSSPLSGATPSTPTPLVYLANTNNSYNHVLNGLVNYAGPFPADTTYYFRAKVEFWNSGAFVNTRYGSTLSKKMWASDPTVGTPSLSAEGIDEVTVDGSWTPETVETTVTCYVQYKKSSDSTWTTWGTPADTGSGSGSLSIDSTTVTGLDNDTSYDFRLYVDRTGTTNTQTDYFGSSATTSTLPGDPTFDVEPAISISFASAYLGASSVHNSADALAIAFSYGTTTQSKPGTTDLPGGANDPYDSTTGYVLYSYDSGDDGTAYHQITGLTSSTDYYYRAFGLHFNSRTLAVIEYLGWTDTEETFTTPATPDEKARAEARMQVYEYKRRYGTLLAAGSAPLNNGPLFFTLQSPADTDSDTFVVGATVGAADCLISKDGGSFAQTTNQPATLGNGYTLILTAAELQCHEADIIIKDAAGGPDFRDCHLRVITQIQLGGVDIDAATGTKANSTAFKATGYGSGHGIQGIGGGTGNDIDGLVRDLVVHTGTSTAAAASTITLDTGASTTADFYNGDIIMIVSTGEVRMITDYTTGRVATVDEAWSSAPSANEFVIFPGGRVFGETWGELSAIPSASASAKDKMQGLFQRFFFRISQTATTQTWYKADGTTTLDSRAVSDNGVTQLIEEF